jgi:hypothetical protein
MAKSDFKAASRPGVAGCQSAPLQSTLELADKISGMFGDLSFDVMYQKSFAERIYYLAIEDGACIATEAQAYSYLRNTATLLIKRVRMLEVMA